MLIDREFADRVVNDARSRKGAKDTQSAPFSALDGLVRTGVALFERNGGDDGTRTRGLCRDRAAF